MKSQKLHKLTNSIKKAFKGFKIESYRNEWKEDSTIRTYFVLTDKNRHRIDIVLYEPEDPTNHEEWNFYLERLNFIMALGLWSDNHEED